MSDFTGSDEELGTILTDVFACNRVWSAWSVGTMTEDDFVPAAEDPDIPADLIAWRDAAVAAERERLRTDPGGHPEGNAIEAYCATGAGDGDGRHLLQYAVRLPDGTTAAYGDQSWVSAGLGARDAADGASTVVRDIWVSYGPWRTHETTAAMAAREKE